MTAQSVHQIDVCFAFLGVASWAPLMIVLDRVAHRRILLMTLATLAPLHHAYARLPEKWGPLHGVLIAATLLWLGGVLAPGLKLRPWLFVAAAACLSFVTTAWALSAGRA